MQATKICNHCSSEIPTSASVCPYCTRDFGLGDDANSPFGALIVLGVVVFMLYKACTGG